MSFLAGTGGTVSLGNAVLTVDQSMADSTYAGAITGSGSLVKTGSSTLTLSGVNTYTGDTTVNAGTLAINGAMGGTIGSSNVLVNLNGTLTGTNNAIIGNEVTINGTLLGQVNEVVRMNSLILEPTAILNVGLDMPSSQALFVVATNVILDGSLVVTQGPDFGPGIYRLINYSGSLVDDGLATNDPDFYILKQPGEVSLVNTTGVTLNYWDGNGPYFNDQINGGSGTWSLNNTNISWTNAAMGSLAAGALNGVYKPDDLPAVFTTMGGVVIVDNSAGQISAAGLQFLVDGYQVGGDSLALTAPEVFVAGSATAQISASLIGAVGLTKTGTGTLLLAGVNSYSGTTTVTDGVLGATVAGAFINDSPYVVNGGVLVLNGFDLTMSSLSGTGGIVDIGTAHLTVNQADTTTYAGSLAGTGLFTKAGTGTLILTGNSSGFGGNTNVDAGGLTVDGQLDGNVVVAAGARLKGNGIIGGTVTVDGIIAPGNSIGTITVNGNYTQNPGSIYEDEINAAGASDLILVHGTATLNGGIVEVFAAPGNYAANTRYTILTADGGRTGTYDGLTTQVPFNQPFLQFALTYDPNHVFLNVVRSSLAFSAVGETQNQRNTGAGTESLGVGNPVFDAVVNLATAEEARRAFDSLSGEIHVSALSVFIEESRYVREAAMNRLAQVFGAFGPFGQNGVIETTAGDGGIQPMVAILPEWGVWAQGFGSWGQLESNGNASTVDRSIGGAFLGVDRQFGDYIRLGLLGGYSQSNFNVGDVRDSRGISDNYYLALYGGAQWEQLRIRAGGAYTWHDLDVTRNVVFPGFVNTLTSSYGAHTAQAFAEAGYGLSWWGMGLEPFIGAAYVNVDTNRWTEQGGAAALTGKGQEDVFYTTLGIRQAAALFERGGLTIGENVLLGWRHAYNDITPESTLAFATGSIPFVIGGVPIAQNALMIDAGLDFGNPANNLNFKVSYIGQVGNDVQDHGVMGVLSWRF
jgi:outer membrane autotransporter protein